MQDQKRALRLDAGQFNRLIKITRATSRYPERDVTFIAEGSPRVVSTVVVKALDFIGQPLTVFMKPYKDMQRQ